MSKDQPTEIGDTVRIVTSPFYGGQFGYLLVKYILGAAAILPTPTYITAYINSKPNSERCMQEADLAKGFGLAACASCLLDVFVLVLLAPLPFLAARILYYFFVGITLFFFLAIFLHALEAYILYKAGGWGYLQFKPLQLLEQAPLITFDFILLGLVMLFAIISAIKT